MTKKKSTPSKNGKIAAGPKTESEAPVIKITPKQKVEKVRKEFTVSFIDTGKGFESQIGAKGFSLFEQIGILESLKQRMISENFTSQKN